MFALRSRHRHPAEASYGVGWRGSVSGGRFVLPRWLRRPARIVERLRVGDYDPPPFAATMASAVLFAAAGIYGAIAGGHADAVVQAVTSRSGFAVADVRITGNQNISDIDILQEVGLDGWTSLVGLDVSDARKRIAALPWVESVSVRKIYPTALDVEIVERQPFAIWQHGSELTLVERSGNVIAPFAGGRYASLPLLIGMGSTEAGPEFIDRLKRTPELAARVRAYVRVAERRWNLVLRNGITIKLPEAGEDAAIGALVAMDKESGLLSRDIASVDLRFADRLVVQLTPEAATRREAALKEQLSRNGRRGANI